MELGNALCQWVKSEKETRMPHDNTGQVSFCNLKQVLQTINQII